MYQVLVNVIIFNFDIKYKIYKLFFINIEKKKMDVDFVMGIDIVYIMYSVRFQLIKLLKLYLIIGKIRKKKIEEMFFI